MQSFTQLPKSYGFIFLLVSLVLLLIMPAYWQSEYKGIVTSIIITMILLSFLALVVDKKIELIIGVLLAIPILFSTWSGVANSDKTPSLLASVSGALFFIYIVIELMRSVLLKKQAVTFNVIAAAICVYFLLAVVWAYVYMTIELSSPGAILGQDLRHAPNFANQLIYFSFVTMTTLGFGDITPQTEIAKNWVVLQAVVGQFYIAVLVARLVALYTTQHN